MERQHIDIAQVGERRAIGDNARQADLTLRGVQTEAERSSEGALDHLEWDVFRPVRTAQVGMDCLRIQPFWSGGDYVRSALILLDAHLEDLLTLLRRHRPDLGRELCVNYGINRPVSYVATRWVLAKKVDIFPIRRWYDRSGNKAASTIGTHVAQYAIGT